MRSTVAGLAAALAACGTTVEDGAPGSILDGTVPGGVIVDEDVPETTVPIAGSATELLPALVTDVSRLSFEISEGGPDVETLIRIEETWAAARDEVLTQRPGLVNGIDTAVTMARTAVERTRPADADKAFALLTDLVDDYTGDG